MPTATSDLDRVAGHLSASLGLLVRRLRQVHVHGDITLSQASVLVRLERDGPATPGTLATVEQITPQSMGAILAALQENGLVSRSGDPSDGRRVRMPSRRRGRPPYRASATRKPGGWPGPWPRDSRRPNNAD